MANPLFNVLNGQQSQNDMAAAFQNFMQQMRGKNPHDVMQNMINTYNISQEQLNQLQGQANQIRGRLDGLKSMFGFK